MIAILVFSLVVSLAAALTSGNKRGGAVCDYTLTFNHFYEGVQPGGDPGFPGYLSVNATGYFQSGPAYYTGAICANPAYLWNEQGIAEFSFTFNNVEYVWTHGDFLEIWSENPWLRHFPIGLASNLTNMKDIYDTYFEEFSFVTWDGVLQWCDDACVCDNENSGYCIVKVERTDCYDNQIDFAPDTFITLTPDNIVSAGGQNVHWYVLNLVDVPNAGLEINPVSVCHGGGLVFRDAHGIDQDFSQQMCDPATYGWYFRQTPNWAGAELDFSLIMGPGLGQAQRLQFQMWYHSLPISSGEVCVYFDYSGLQWASIPDNAQISFNRIWCGELEPYNAGKMVLTLDFPLTYPPAFDSVFVDTGPDYAMGYSTYRPLIIRGSTKTAFVVYNVTINAMGEAYTTDCYQEMSGWDGGKRRQGAPVPTSFTDPDAANAFWSTWTPPTKPDRTTMDTPDFLKNRS
jgi:hypothetical protein